MIAALLTFLRNKSTTVGVIFMVAFAFLPFFVLYALAAQAYSSPPRKMPRLLLEKAKTKRVDTKSAARFVFPKDEIIVQFKRDAIDIANKKGIVKARTFAAKNNMVVKDILRSMNAIVVQSTKKETTATAMQRLRKESAVKLVQKNFRASLKNNPKRK